MTDIPVLQRQYSFVFIFALAIVLTFLILFFVYFYSRKSADNQTEYRKFDNSTSSNKVDEQRCWKLIRFINTYRLNYQRFVDWAWKKINNAFTSKISNPNFRIAYQDFIDNNLNNLSYGTNLLLFCIELSDRQLHDKTYYKKHFQPENQNFK